MVRHAQILRGIDQRGQQGLLVGKTGFDQQAELSAVLAVTVHAGIRTQGNPYSRFVRLAGCHEHLRTHDKGLFLLSCGKGRILQFRPARNGIARQKRRDQKGATLPEAKNAAFVEKGAVFYGIGARVQCGIDPV